MNIEKIPLKKIIRIENSRAKIGDVASLMESIKREGLLNPLTVCLDYKDKTSGKYFIIAGNRRYEALRKLGESYASCLIRTDILDEKSLMITNLTENAQRKNTSIYEQGRFMYLLGEQFKMSIKEMTVRLSQTVSYVKGCIDTYKKVPERYREKIVFGDNSTKKSGFIPLSTSVKIQEMSNSRALGKEKTNQLYDLVMQKGLGIPAIQEIGRNMSGGFTLEESVIMLDNTTLIRTDIVVTKKELADLRKFNDKTMKEIIAAILYGEMATPFTNPLTIKNKAIANKKMKKVKK